MILKYYFFEILLFTFIILYFYFLTNGLTKYVAISFVPAIVRASASRTNTQDYNNRDQL